MGTKTVDYRDQDALIWEEELEGFVPEKVFDAHCHLFDPDCVENFVTVPDNYTPIDLGRMREWAGTVFPGRTAHFLLVAKPHPRTDAGSYNRMLAQEVAKDGSSRAHCLATPAYGAGDLERDIKRYGFQGVKVYRCFSVTGDAAECRIHEYFPHDQLEVANRLGLWVTLHLATSDACADERNLRDLEEFTTRRYPNIKWILAHCARSFTYYPIQRAIDRLRDLPNLWYDLSAVTDVRPFVTLFRRERLDRLFYGSDGVDAVSHHGKYIALGRAWQTFFADRSGLTFSHCQGRPILALYEQLLAIKHAAEIAELSRPDIERIFWGNAAREFGIDEGKSRGKAAS